MKKKLKDDFELLRSSDVVYLDSAATSQKPNEVIEAEANFYKSQNANIHRGAYSLSVEATNMYNEARNKVKEFINAMRVEEIIFTKNATESINLVAYSYALNTLKEGDEIVLSIMEHHSNIVPWQYVAKKTGAKIAYMYINDDYRLTKEEIDKKITKNTKIVAVTYVSNVTGVINDVKYISKVAHANGAKILIDATQAVPHFKVDVKYVDADFLVFSSHKMLGPMGIGVLYAKNSLLQNMSPFLMGGDMIEYVYEDSATFAPLPNKFEAGTQNIAGAIGLKTAIEYIEKVGYDYIEKKDKEILNYAITKLKELDYLKLYIPKDLENSISVISFNIEGVHPHDTASLLDMKKVCVRSGNHCAQPLMRYLGIDSTCRASIYLYNEKEDIDRLVDAIQFVYESFKKYLKK